MDIELVYCTIELLYPKEAIYLSEIPSSRKSHGVLMHNILSPHCPNFFPLCPRENKT